MPKKDPPGFGDRRVKENTKGSLHNAKRPASISVSASAADPSANGRNRPIAVNSAGRQCVWMSSGLTLTYSYTGDPNDDFGWLGVAVVGERSSGRGGFWVQWQDVKAFGEKLSTYPVQPEAPIKAEWGYEPWEGDALVVSVEIAPAGKRGDLAVKVWLRDHTEMGEGEPSECLRTSFITHYPELEAFRREIANLMDGKAEEAKLLGS